MTGCRFELDWLNQKCRHEAEPGHEFCIFHIPLEEKRNDPSLADRFDYEFDMLYQKGDWNFAGFQFPDQTDLGGRDFRWSPELGSPEPGTGPDRWVPTFVGTVFGKRVNLKGVVFGDNVRFFGAEFGPGLNFSEAIFGGNTFFFNAVFEEEACFEGSAFGRDVSFWGSRFGPKASFRKAVFGDFAAFQEAVFEGGTDFSMANFGDECDFRDVHFGDNTIFRDACFGHKAGFHGALFGRNTRFQESSFGDTAIFTKAAFGPNTRFRGATFTGAASFEETVFDGPAFFTEIQGQEKQTRPLVHRQGLIEIVSQYEFLQAAAPGLIFKGAIFAGPARFTRTNLTRSRFEQVDLSRVSFLGAHVTDTRFICCSWGQAFENKRFHRRIDPESPFVQRTTPWLRFRRQRVLYDELLWRKDEEASRKRGWWEDSVIRWFATEVEPFRTIGRFLFSGMDPEDLDEEEGPPEMETVITASDVEVLSLQIKRALEEARDAAAAGDFHFSVMEMRREQALKEGRRLLAAALWFHRLFNGYGERCGRALGWLFLAWVAFTLIYAHLNFLGAADPKAAAMAADAWTRIRFGASYALGHMLPFGALPAHLSAGISEAASWLTSLQVMIGAGLAAAFLQAVWRRLRR